jgi:AcrR family transcriptional regulator
MAAAHATGRDDDHALRRDAEANRARLLEAAAAAVRRSGEKVPMASIAADAGVGVGTLYRHFPTRTTLLAALERRSYRLVLEHARAAAACAEPAIDCLRHFLEHLIADRDDLVLPLLGGHVSLDRRTVALRTEITDTLDQIFARGRADSSIRRDASAVDIIITGAFLTTPLPLAPNWDQVARRQAHIFLAGLAASNDAPLPGRRTTRKELEQSFATPTPTRPARRSSACFRPGREA